MRRGTAWPLSRPHLSAKLALERTPWTAFLLSRTWCSGMHSGSHDCVCSNEGFMCCCEQATNYRKLASTAASSSGCIATGLYERAENSLSRNANADSSTPFAITIPRASETARQLAAMSRNSAGIRAIGISASPLCDCQQNQQENVKVFLHRC
jgi:hypothetical protein